MLWKSNFYGKVTFTESQEFKNEFKDLLSSGQGDVTIMRTL